MAASVRKIYWLILAIVILPSLIFVIYEIGTIRQSEKIIEDIYTNQLDAILYSVNQYSEDVLSGWANRINNEQNEDKTLQSALIRIHGEMPSVSCIFQFDSLRNRIAISAVEEDPAKFKPVVDSILHAQSTALGRLFTYITSGYRKIEAVDLNDGSQLIFFLTNFRGEYIINSLILNSREFISRVLDPKIQEIAGERFFITAYFKADGPVIYSSDKQYLPENVAHRKTFWVLDDYYLGIELKDKTISDLAWERSKKDLIVIAVVEIVLLLGVWIIFKNVNKQMELAQMKSDFVSNVSHEIRTPLSLISMYIESLERGMATTPEKVKEYYHIVMQETQRLISIVNKILSFSQLESGKRKLSFQNIDLMEIAESVVATFKVNLENQEFQWSIKAMEEDLQLIADREAVTDAVFNLVDNAIKYSGTDKKIEIEVGRAGNEVFLKVTDHGIGIRKAEQKHIFDKFYRITDRNLAHQAKGSGVGLSIVKQIVEAHEGRVSIKSKTGAGTSFTLYFPRIKTSIP
ncbi:MAG: HAMP domain-containing histidine kinase [Cytophagales bacterium]|nr:HAMP domain-containing histidine kinase [Cytophagales bacterium]